MIKIIMFICLISFTYCIRNADFEVQQISDLQIPKQNMEDRNQLKQNWSPIRLTYIDKIPAWWPAEAIAAGLGVPGFAQKTLYNHIVFSVWNLLQGPINTALIWSDPVRFMGADSPFGRNNSQIWKNLMRRYHDNGIRVLVQAFSNTELPASHGIDPIVCAEKLSQFVLDKNLDGVEIAWLDTQSMKNGEGIKWLFLFTSKLRQRLPYHIIAHAPVAPYFSSQQYPKGSFTDLNQKIGRSIDFYNILFYNQGKTSYDSYEKLFLQSGGDFPNTSVRQIQRRGIQLNKIVIGKPVSASSMVNSGWIPSQKLGDFIQRASNQIGWRTGVAYWEYINDSNGSSIKNATNILGTSQNAPKQQKQIRQNFREPKHEQINQPQKKQQLKPTYGKIVKNIAKNDKREVLKTDTRNVFFTYVNTINSWWPAQAIASGLGVPDYAPDTPYNYFALAFWTYNTGPVDTALIWSNPLHYMGNQSPFGKTKQQIQINILQKFKNKNKKLMVSAFGATQFPTSAGYDPIKCAEKLAEFVLENRLDGVDIDWQDNQAMEAGKGQQWLIKFTIKLRQLLPKKIITHAPQAPYFKQQYYKNGAYITIHKKIGHLIDFYNVQFYNQGDTTYSNYQLLFKKANGFFSGTSVQEIINRGVPKQKIIIGKPATQGDAMNSGYMTSQSLGQCVSRAVKQLNWNSGLMYWQYKNDYKGEIASNAGRSLLK